MSATAPKILPWKGRWQAAGLTEGCTRSNRRIGTPASTPLRRFATPPLSGEDLKISPARID